jgi:hypothetical protein
MQSADLKDHSGHDTIRAITGDYSRRAFLSGDESHGAMALA